MHNSFIFSLSPYMREAWQLDFFGSSPFWLGLRPAHSGEGLWQALGICLQLAAPLAAPRLQRCSPTPTDTPQTGPTESPACSDSANLPSPLQPYTSWTYPQAPSPLQTTCPTSAMQLITNLTCPCTSHTHKKQNQTNK